MLYFLVLGHNIYPTQHFLVADLIVLNKKKQKKIINPTKHYHPLIYWSHTVYATKTVEGRTFKTLFFQNGVHSIIYAVHNINHLFF